MLGALLHNHIRETSSLTSVEKKRDPLFIRDYNWWKYIVLLTYITLVIFAISYHEPWHDEVQSWLLARDSNPLTLLFRYLRYEGHPGLWHFLLMVPAKLGLPLVTLNLISGAVMAVTVYLILFKSRFPVIIKILLPFSFLFLYQYAVVSRSYCLILLLLSLIATIYGRRTERPYTYFALLVLLANTSINGTIMALALFVLLLRDLHRKWPTISKQNQKRHIVGMAILILCLLLLIVILWPPSDQASAARYQFGITNLYRISTHAINSALTDYWYVSFSLLAMILLWFFKRRVLLTFLVITVPSLVFFADVYSAPWHWGLFFAVLVFVFWLSFEEEASVHQREFRLQKLPLRKIAVASLLLILCFQIYYSVQSFRAEFRVRYSASLDLANYIKKNDLERKKIGMLGSMQTSVLAYFNRNIFYNYNNGHGPCFWLYSTTKNRYVWDINNKITIERFASEKPDYVVLTLYGKPEKKYNIPGYKPIKVFHGYMVWKDDLIPNDSIFLYKRI